MNKTAKCFFTAVTALILLAAALFTGRYALSLKYGSEERMKNCTAHADAKIASVDDANIIHRLAAIITGMKPTENEGTSMSIYTVTYKVKDKKYTFKEPALPEAGLNKGAKVSVSYDPNDPSSAYLYLPEARMKLTPVIVTSAVFAVLAVLRLLALKKILR